MDTYDTIKRIESDFAERAGPFSDDLFPEHRLVNTVEERAGDLSMEERARLATAFSTFDYNRDANRLVDNLLELHDTHPAYLDPTVPASEEHLSDVMGEIGFRYPSRDATAWVSNCSVLRQQYHGQATELLLDTGLDAIELLDRLDSDDFYCLCGDKIGPMYARIISDEVVTLDRLWELDIPVDTHIEQLTKELADDDLQTRADVREWWRVLASETDVQRHVVDGGLWMIGNQWNEWGKDYWQEVTVDGES